LLGTIKSEEKLGESHIKDAEILSLLREILKEICFGCE
jgi:hypothetical protein